MSKDAPFPRAAVPVIGVSFEQAVAAFREECQQRGLTSSETFPDALLDEDEIHPVRWGGPVTGDEP